MTASEKDIIARFDSGCFAYVYDDYGMVADVYGNGSGSVVVTCDNEMGFRQQWFDTGAEALRYIIGRVAPEPRFAFEEM